MTPAKSTFEARSAGMKPKISELAHDRTSANATNVQSVDVLTAIGTGAAELKFASRRKVPDAVGVGTRLTNEKIMAANGYVSAAHEQLSMEFVGQIVQLKTDRTRRQENFLGGALLATGNVTAALIHFRRATALAPRDARLHFNLAKVLAATGRPQDAFVEYTRALAIDPAFGEAHQQVGALLFSVNRLAEALAHLQRAVELLPESADAHGDLGGALAEAGRRDEALVHLRRAVAIDPRNPTARENLSRLEQVKPR